MCRKCKPNISVKTNIETFQMNIYYMNFGSGVYTYFRANPNLFQQITVY